MSDPDEGFYAGVPVGPDAHFVTSPHVDQLFGWCVAGWAHWLWTAMDRPTPFTIFEPGAGEGVLAGQVLDWAAGRDDGWGRARGRR